MKDQKVDCKFLREKNHALEKGYRGNLEGEESLMDKKNWQRDEKTTKSEIRQSHHISSRLPLSRIISII